MRRSRAELDALERFEAALAGVDDGEDLAQIGAAVAVGTGAERVDVVDDTTAAAASLERELNLSIGGRPVTLRAVFAHPKLVPSDAAITLVGVRAQARVDELAARHANDVALSRHRARAELAMTLVGLFDPEAIEAALRVAVVGTLADDCTLTRISKGDDGADDDRAFVRRDERWLIRATRAEAWRRDELDELDSLAELVLRALSAHAQYEAELHTRTVIERSLVPEAFVPMPGVAIASRYRPAGGGREAGGDFYDVVRNEPGVTILIGDVQGKGVEAATVTSLARHTLRNGALRGIAPRALLAELNTALLYGQREQELAEGFSPTRFVTAAVATLSPTDRGMHLVVARGGHPPPVVIRWQGDIEVLQPSGILLGVKPSPHFEEMTTELLRGDTLVLYTDGITEHRDLNEAFDERMLGMLVRSSRQIAGIEARADLVLETTLLRVPPDARDDIAVVLVTVTGPDD